MSLLSDETITTVIKVALHGRKWGGTSILCRWFCISCIVSSPCSRTSWMVVIMWCDSEQKTWPHHVFVTFHFCVVVVTVSGNLYWKKKSLQQWSTETSVNCPPENSLLPCEWSQWGSAVYWWWLYNHVIQSKNRNFEILTNHASWKVTITAHYNCTHIINKWSADTWKLKKGKRTRSQ